MGTQWLSINRVIVVMGLWVDRGLGFKLIRGKGVYMHYFLKGIGRL